MLAQESYQPFVARKPSTYVITEDALVEHLASNLSLNHILSTVESLTQFTNRSSLCATGYQAAIYLKETFEEVAQNAQRTLSVPSF